MQRCEYECLHALRALGNDIFNRAATTRVCLITAAVSLPLQPLKRPVLAACCVTTFPPPPNARSESAQIRAHSHCAVAAPVVIILH